MKKTLQLFAVIFSLTGVAFGIWYGGGIALAVALGVLALTGLIAVSFLLGSHWTYRLLREGARIAIDSSSVQEQGDAARTRAVADLLGQAVRQVRQQPAASAPPEFPAIPPLLDAPADRSVMLTEYAAGRASFTIAGLDEEEPDADQDT